AVVDPQPGVLRCDLVIDDAALVRGRVVDATDQPLVGWLVTADLGDKSVWMHTGRGGSFCLALPTAGEATLTARAVGARTAAVSRGIHAGQTVELRVPGAAVPSAMVRGRLPASDGTPAAACR